jgi:hypothetical protein
MISTRWSAASRVDGGSPRGAGLGGSRGVARRERARAGASRRLNGSRASAQDRGRVCVAFLGLGGVGETPETRWGGPPVTAACWPTVGAPSERDEVGGGEKRRGRQPALYTSSQAPVDRRRQTRSGRRSGRLMRVARWGNSQMPRSCLDPHYCGDLLRSFTYPSIKSSSSTA